MPAFQDGGSADSSAAWGRRYGSPSLSRQAAGWCKVDSGAPAQPGLRFSAGDLGKVHIKQAVKSLF